MPNSCRFLSFHAYLALRDPHDESVAICQVALRGTYAQRPAYRLEVMRLIEFGFFSNSVAQVAIALDP